MKLYFPSRKLARAFKSSAKSPYRVVDSKDKPSAKGSRWAVEPAK